jgi:hypothetical protein
MHNRIVTAGLTEWSAPAAFDRGGLAEALEEGSVIYFPGLAYRLSEDEKRFLSPEWADGHAKNISYDGETGELKGAHGDASSLAALKAMVVRFREQALTLVETLFPHYAERLRAGRTSFRPARVERREASWRKDDSRLHVDAFPSRPNQGERILRIFTNVNPDGQPRVWRVGERFEDLAKHLTPRIRPPLPGSATLFRALGITKSLRSEYDHYMLQLHDAMKADPSYQSDRPQLTFAFPPGSTWVCFPDQTPHAAMSGQYMCEQTVHFPVTGLHRPESAPLKVLERVLGHALV